MEAEEVRAVPVADAERVGASGGGDERRARAAAFEQGVGGAGGAQPDPHGADAGRERKAREPADSGHGSFFVGGEFAPDGGVRTDRKRAVKGEKLPGGIKRRHRCARSG